MNHSDCTISIVTFNALDHAKACLKAVLASRGEAKLVLTSNGNADVTDFFRSVSGAYPDVSVIVNDRNHGFIAPNNLAFDGCASDFFVLLNDDAIPPPNWLDNLKRAFDDPAVAVAGPSGGCCTLNDRFIGYRGPVLDYIEGSCMMVRARYIRGIQGRGLFSTYINFAYGEDADLCLRVRRAGLAIKRCPFTIKHARSATTRTVPGLGSIMRQNLMVCAEKWRPYFEAGRKFPHEP